MISDFEIDRSPPNYVYHSDRDPWLAVEQAYMRKSGINAAPLQIRDMDGPKLAAFLDEHFAPRAGSWKPVPLHSVRNNLERLGHLPAAGISPLMITGKQDA